MRLKSSFKDSPQQKSTASSPTLSPITGLRNYHGELSSFVALIFKFVKSQKRLHYLNLRRNIKRLEFMTTKKNLLEMVWKPTLRRDLPFSRLKVMQGTYLELWRAICWCIWKTKGGDRKKTRGSQVPSDVSLDCVSEPMCISWCIFITIL